MPPAAVPFGLQSKIAEGEGGQWINYCLYSMVAYRGTCMARRRALSKALYIAPV
jgi:hypothetical protein